MRLLFLGDMVGKTGRTAVWERLPGLIGDLKLDFVIVNGENAAGGFGITEDIFLETINAGADVVTTGNHVWDQKEAVVFCERHDQFLRPANYPAGTPGRGSNLFFARNGARVLPTVLHTHAPLDLVIILLGTNDMKPVFANNAVIVGHGIKRLVEIVRHHAWQLETEGPEILVVSPPALCETDHALLGPMFAGRIAESRNLASVYRDVADELGCGFFDAGSVARTTPIDGVHMDAENTRAVGRGLEPIVRMMLGM